MTIILFYFLDESKLYRKNSKPYIPPEEPEHYPKKRITPTAMPLYQQQPTNKTKRPPQHPA
jgi:hypothetical protein